MRRMLLSMNHPCSSCDGSRRPFTRIVKRCGVSRHRKTESDGTTDMLKGKFIFSTPSGLVYSCPLMLLGIPRLKHAAPAPRQVEMSPDGPVEF